MGGISAAGGGVEDVVMVGSLNIALSSFNCVSFASSATGAPGLWEEDSSVVCELIFSAVAADDVSLTTGAVEGIEGTLLGSGETEGAGACTGEVFGVEGADASGC